MYVSRPKPTHCPSSLVVAVAGSASIKPKAGVMANSRSRERERDRGEKDLPHESMVKRRLQTGRKKKAIDELLILLGDAVYPACPKNCTHKICGINLHECVRTFRAFDYTENSITRKIWKIHCRGRGIRRNPLPHQSHTSICSVFWWGIGGLDIDIL